MKFKSAKTMTSKLFLGKVYEVELTKLHNVLLHILKDFKACCERHGLKYMLCGGSCLGAVRHQGFIPWDDDADVMMPREDFDKVAAFMLEDYGDKYSVNNMELDHVLNFMLKGTLYKEITTGDSGGRNIFLDVYPIDNMPKGKRRFRASRFFWAKHACSFISEYKHPSEIIKNAGKTDKALASYFRKRRALGCLFSIFGSPAHYNRVVTKLAKYKKATGYLGIPCAIAYNREKFRAEVLTETIDAEFCGVTFKIPKFYDEYLTNLYGADYMVIPPPEKQEVHAAKIEFGIYENLNEKGEFDE